MMSPDRSPQQPDSGSEHPSVMLVGQVILCQLARDPPHLVDFDRGSEGSLEGVISQYMTVLDRFFRSRYRTLPTARSIRQVRPVSSATSRRAVWRSCSPTVRFPFGNVQSSYEGRWTS